ncbi:hypothetical protein Tco_0580728 [Tanacetum coccineum]
MGQDPRFKEIVNQRLFTHSARVAKQRVAKQRVAKQRVAKQRVAKQRVAKQRVAKQRVAKQRVTKQRFEYFIRAASCQKKQRFDYSITRRFAYTSSGLIILLHGGLLTLAAV